MPSRAIWWVLSPSMRRPSKWTAPASGRSRLVMRLKTVVLPEPLGPMRPTMLPVATSKEHSLTARSPPKSFRSPATASAGASWGGAGASGFMRPAGASLLLPRVRGDRHVFAARAGGHGGGIDRHLLAALDLHHHGLDGHPMPLGERGEFAGAPGGGEGAGLHDRLDGDESRVVRLDGEVGGIGARLLAVRGHHRLRNFGVPRGPPAVVDDGALHDLGVLIDERLGRHRGAHVDDEGRHLEL